MTVSQIQNFYKATITRTWSATTGDFNVSVKPTVSSGYLVISPNNTLLREIVYYTATGTNAYGDFVTISNISGRGLGGTSAQIHNIGEPIRMNITAQHWDDLIASAVAPTVDVGTTTTLDPGSDATATNSGSTVAAVIDFEIPAGSTIYSGTSIPDNSVGRNGDWAFDTSVNCYVWYKSGGTWALVNSLKGATGDGNGIASITKTGTVGLVDTYTITYDDATTSTFNITNGEQGVQGDAGVSVVSIIKTDTVGLVDTYTITYSNSTTSTFTVTNGQDGTNGLDGTDGIDGTNGIDGTDGISFTPKGAYNALTEYIANDVVSYLGSTWIALQTTTGNTPEEGAYWTLNAAKGTDGEGSGDMILADVQSVTGLKTFDTTKLAVKGSSTGKTAIASENASATDYTATLPAKDGTIAMTSDIVSQVEDSIVDGHTTIAPSGNAVFDALALKAPLASPTFTGTVTIPKTTEIQDTTGDHQYVLAVNELTADRTVTLPLLTGNDEFVFKDHTQTLTNKRITKRVASTTDDATAVIDSDSYDEYYLTAIANATEISITGTPTAGQTIFIGLKDAGSAKALTWTGITGLGQTLPTTTVEGKQHIIGLKYIASAWRAIAVSVEA